MIHGRYHVITYPPLDRDNGLLSILKRVFSVFVDHGLGRQMDKIFRCMPSGSRGESRQEWHINTHGHLSGLSISRSCSAWGKRVERSGDKHIEWQILRKFNETPKIQGIGYTWWYLRPWVRPRLGDMCRQRPEKSKFQWELGRLQPLNPLASRDPEQ